MIVNVKQIFHWKNWKQFSQKQSAFFLKLNENNVEDEGKRYFIHTLYLNKKAFQRDAYRPLANRTCINGHQVSLPIGALYNEVQWTSLGRYPVMATRCH